MKKSVRIIPSSEGPFKYFQIKVFVGGGVSGRVLLNDYIMDSFRGPSQMSNNEAQQAIVEGENCIKLLVDKIDAKTTPAAFSKSVIQIDLHGLLAPGIADLKSRVISIVWDPEGKSKDERTYSFKMHRTPDAPPQ